MKKLLCLLLLVFAVSFVASAQPGDPGGDPDQCGQHGTWTLHASQTTINSGESVTITATLDNPQPGGASYGSITVTAGSPACILADPDRQITKTILCGSTEVTIGTFTLTDMGCFIQMTKQFNISGTGGCTGGTGVSVVVNQ